MEMAGEPIMATEAIAEGIRFQAEHCRQHGAPITAAIVEAQLALLDSPTAVGRRLSGWHGKVLEDAVPLRLAAGFHHLNLTGGDRRLDPVYRGVITEQAAIDTLVLALVDSHEARLLPWFDSPPQTNEAGRAAAIMGGLMWLTHRGAKAFELLEIGASAGINTMMDRFGYDLGGTMAGDPLSPLQLMPEWRGQPPPDVPVEITRIVGCDQRPIDLTDPVAALRLKSYVWAEAGARLARFDAAVELAGQCAPVVEQADAADWLERRLALPQQSGTTRVLLHSIVWQYLPDFTRQRIEAAMFAANERADNERPIAWLMLETNRDTFRHELKIHCRGGEGACDWTILAEAHAHGGWVNWLA